MRLEDAKLKLSLPEAIGDLASSFLNHCNWHHSLWTCPPYSNYSGTPFLICLWEDQEAAIFNYGGGYRQKLQVLVWKPLYILFIGMLISIWMASGTIPTIMFYGFDWISGEYFYAITFLVCSLIGLCIGSSFATSATIGVALIGMAAAMDLSLAITAGAIISGAFWRENVSIIRLYQPCIRERLEHDYLNILIICFGLRFRFFHIAYHLLLPFTECQSSRVEEMKP